MKHRVKSGETLSSIARQFGFKSIYPIYDHSENKEFKELRPNPDVIYEGDELFIPEIESAKFKIELNQKNTFTISLPKETLSLLLQFEEDDEVQGGNVETILIVDEVEYPSTADGDGLVEWKIPKSVSRKGIVRLFMEPDQNEATHEFEVSLGDLNPVTENTGIQARLNGLGFNCGKVDGKLRARSENAIKKFQGENNLTVDGIAGPNTQKALADNYGC